MRRVTGAKLTLQETLLAAICDDLSLLVWFNTKDAQKGRNRPKSILSELTKVKEKPITYKDGAAFLAAREAILGGGADGD